MKIDFPVKSRRNAMPPKTLTVTEAVRRFSEVVNRVAYRTTRAKSGASWGCALSREREGRVLSDPGGLDSPPGGG